MIGLVQVGTQSMADRYVYIPFWGLASRLGGRSLRRCARGRLARRAQAAGARALGRSSRWRFSGLTWRQAAALAGRASRSSEAAIANTERNWLAHSALAERYYARSEFRAAIERSPRGAEVHRNAGTVRSTYGLALYETWAGRSEALEQFELAVPTRSPTNPIGYMNLGWIYVGTQTIRPGDSRDSRTARQRISEADAPAYTKRDDLRELGQRAREARRPAEAAREKYERALAMDAGGPAVLREAPARVDLQMRRARRTRDRRACGRAWSSRGGCRGARWLLAGRGAAARSPGRRARCFGARDERDARQGGGARSRWRGRLPDRRAPGGRGPRPRRCSPSRRTADPGGRPFLASTIETRAGRSSALGQGDAVGAEIAALDRALAV